MQINRKSLTIQDIFFFFFLVVLSFMFYQMLRPFLVDLFLTIVLSIMFQRVYQYFKRKPLLGPSGGAVITIFIVLVVLFIPLTFVGTMVTKEIAYNYKLISTELPSWKKEFDNGAIQQYVDKNEKLKTVVDNLDMVKLRTQLEEAFKTVTGILFRVAQETILSITNVAFHALMIVFFLFFFLAQGDVLQRKLQYLIPFDDHDEREFMNKMRSVTEGIVFNTFLMGAIEGTWGGVLLAIAGVPSPFFWGTLMVLLSIIPLVGANAILLPIGIILLLIGNVWQGLLILLLGVGLVTVNQNFIKPRLDGHRSGMHPAIIVIASLGGMFWMGLIGFLAGPFLAAAFVVIWSQFGKKYEKQLLHLNAGQDSPADTE